MITRAEVVFRIIDRHARAALDEIGEVFGSQDASAAKSTTHAARQDAAAGVGTPWMWSFVEERQGESFPWPKTGGGRIVENYTTFRVFEGVSDEGRVRLALGEAERALVWGRDRRYLIAFHVRNGSKEPVAEFLETDDGDAFIAVIRGKGATRREMYGPGDELPQDYEDYHVEVYRDRVVGGWKKYGVVAEEDDLNTLLGHALYQARLRYGVTPTKGGRDA